MRPIVPADGAQAPELEIGLVDQSRRLQVCPRRSCRSRRQGISATIETSPGRSARGRRLVSKLQDPRDFLFPGGVRPVGGEALFVAHGVNRDTTGARSMRRIAVFASTVRRARGGLLLRLGQRSITGIQDLQAAGATGSEEEQHTRRAPEGPGSPSRRASARRAARTRRAASVPGKATVGSGSPRSS